MGERVSGTGEGAAAEEFARLLRELKDRSGLSYGALAKRLHMSTSTLHRYGQGASIPGEYAPVERLARLCRATPRELVELHRRWVLADEERRLKADHAAAVRAGTADPDEAPAEAAVAEETPREAEGPAESVSARSAAPSPGRGEDEEDDPDEPVVVHVPRRPAPPRRRRTALTASAAAAAVLVTAVLVAHPLWGGGGKDARSLKAAAGVASSGPTGAKEPTASASTESASAPSSAPPSAPASASASRSSGPAHHAPAGSATSSGTLPAPLTVSVRPYTYDDPCTHFLVDKAPAHVGVAPEPQDAAQWAATYGAVASRDQRVALTVQGTGADTVVLEALHADVVTKGAPLAWNDYSMSGCGGNVDTKSFDVDLDSGSPAVTVKNGQRAFPYKVSESDPEVFYVTAHTAAHDVRWNLTLEWSSGSRHGTIRIDDDGSSFRTSASVGRPRYECGPGGPWKKVTG
ncbi:helix-turn-helix domain-containing protein [Streptomyces sp. NBC_00433]